jgi:hypothetical protein
MTLSELGLQIAQALLPVVVAFLIALISYGISLLRGKAADIKNDTLRKSLDNAFYEAELVATDAIRATNQVFVDEIKAKSADGKLTKEEAKEAMSIAKNYFLTHLTTNSKSVLEGALGPINEWLESFLEAKLGQTKVEKQVDKLANPT